MQDWTVKDILAWIEGYLADHGDEHPRLSAQWLVADALGVQRIELFTDPHRPLSEEERTVLRGYTTRRGSGEPLQYITGTTDFRFITLAVASGVLIPRPETEVLVSEALAEFSGKPGPLRALDMCTGSGCIACSLAHEAPFCIVDAVDIDDKAVSLAQRNAQTLGLDAVSVYCGSMDAALSPSQVGYDLVISNPPYIPTDVLAALPGEVTRFEPTLALDGGPDGLDLFRDIVAVAEKRLTDHGILAVELHETCLDAAVEYATCHGFRDARIARDLAGRPRVLVARKEEIWKNT